MELQRRFRRERRDLEKFKGTYSLYPKSNSLFYRLLDFIFLLHIFPYKFIKKNDIFEFLFL